MIKIEIKGIGEIELHNLVLDLNGTISCDGKLIPGVAERIDKLKVSLKIYLISADTFGTAQKISEELGITRIQMNSTGKESDQKAAFVESLNPLNTVAIGNGQNDVKMLKIARIGIGIIGQEGMCTSLIQSAKIVVKTPLDALDLLIFPKRLIATLRD